jgi:hypothetical protein
MDQVAELMETNSKLVESLAGGILHLSIRFDRRVNFPYQVGMFIQPGDDCVKPWTPFPGADDGMADYRRRFQRCGDPDEIDRCEHGPFGSRSSNRLPDVMQLVKWQCGFPGQQRPELLNLVPDPLCIFKRGQGMDRVRQLSSER